MVCVCCFLLFYYTTFFTACQHLLATFFSFHLVALVFVVVLPVQSCKYLQVCSFNFLSFYSLIVPHFFGVVNYFFKIIIAVTTTAKIIRHTTSFLYLIITYSRVVVNTFFLFIFKVGRSFHIFTFKVSQ